MKCASRRLIHSLRMAEVAFDTATLWRHNKSSATGRRTSAKERQRHSNSEQSSLSIRLINLKASLSAHHRDIRFMRVNTRARVFQYRQSTPTNTAQRFASAQYKALALRKMKTSPARFLVSLATLDNGKLMTKRVR